MDKRILLETVEPVVLVKYQKGISKKTEKSYCFVDIANQKTYENITINSEVESKLDNFSEGEKVNLTFSLTSFSGRPSITIVDISSAYDD